MKKLLITLGLICSQAFFAQSLTKELAPFSEVKIYDKINAKLIPSTTNKIIITGEASDEVQVLQKKDELKVRMPLTKMLKGDKIEVEIHYANTLDEIEAFEGSYIHSEKPIKAYDLDITAKEGAEVKLEVDVTKLDIKSVTGATVTINGTVSGEAEIDVKTGGVVEAKNLKTTRAEVEINAGGQVNIFVKDYIKARTRAGGTINIYGKPAKIDQQTFAGGTIQQK